MLIAATADIHAPYNLNTFYNSITEMKEEPDIFILAGDIIDRNQHIYLKKIYTIIKDKFPNTKIFSVFGNNEFVEYREQLMRDYPFMNWINDSFVDLGKFYLFGTDGILDSPTRWMLKNRPNIKIEWERKLKNIDNMLSRLKDKDIIFVSHYAPVCETVFGDPAPKVFLCSNKMKEMLLKHKNIRIVIHGHSHYAKIWKNKIKHFISYNVSFYIHKKPVLIEV